MEIEDRSEFKERMKQALRLDPKRAAALTVDMQREFLDETVGQSVVVPAEAERVLGASARLLDLCRRAEIPVVHVYAVRRPEEVAAGFHEGGLAYTTTATRIGASHLPHRPTRHGPDRLAGSPDSEVPATLVAPGDIHVTAKKSLDGFAHTDLDHLLGKILDVEYLLISGVNTDTCVYSTTFTAANLGYSPIVVADCVASMRGADSHAMALELMARSIAWVLTVDEVAERLAR